MAAIAGQPPGAHAAPPQRIAGAYQPVVRGSMIAAAAYYAVITVAHPFYETGWNLLVLELPAAVACAFGLIGWSLLRRRAVSLGALEAIAGGLSSLILLNIMAYELVHFDEHRLVYFVLLALICGTTAPTARLANISVAICLCAMSVFGAREEVDFAGDYAFVALAGGFSALGLSGLIRGAVTRELEARVASDSLAREAEAASRAKSAFLATMSHEIRTPLNGVLGMVQVMSTGRLEPEQAQRLEVVRGSARALMSILNDVLDMAQVESGRFELRPAAFPLGGLTDELSDLYGALAADKGLQFSLTATDDGDRLRWGDEMRLRQIVANLISNALKFTDAGEVRVDITATDDVLTCTVCDTGVGMTPEAQQRVFEPFVQADASPTRRAGGTGLGLAICRQLAHLMGGEVSCRSRPGGGSCFTAVVPLAVVAEAAPSADEDPTRDAAIGMGRLLVVDDNATNRLVLSTFLEHLGLASAAVAGGREAVTAFQSEAWDAVLMDIHMPDMDGIEATRAIRTLERESGRARTPIVAVTASALPDEIGAYLAAGMDAVLSKPIELSALVACLQQLDASPPAAMAARAAG